MKVCILLPNNNPGGGPKAMLRLAAELTKTHEVTVLSPVIDNHYLYLKLSRTGNLQKVIHVLSSLLRQKTNFVADAKLGCEKKRYLRLNAAQMGSFDAIIYSTPWQYFELKELHIAPRVRKLHWVLADYLFCTADGFLESSILEATLSDDDLIAPSLQIKAYLESYGCRVRDAIHGGIDADFITAERADNRREPSILGYYQPRWWVKGGPTLLQCVRHIRLKHPSIRIELFSHSGSAIDQGHAPLCDKYHTGISKERLVQLYRSHDIFIYPSYSDGFPSPPLEAMATGCALVSTNVGTVPEYAIHEHNALICNPMDHKTMIAHVERLIGDDGLRRKLSLNAMTTATQRSLTWEACGERFNEVLESPHV